MDKIDKDFFKYDKTKAKAKTIDDELTKNEIVLFRAKPKKAAYILESSFLLFPFAVVWLIFDTFGMVKIFSAFSSVIALFPILLFFAVHLTPFWLWLGGVLRATKKYKNIEYAITDKRVLIRDGTTYVDVKSIYFKDIQSFALNKSVTDQLLHVGDIMITYKKEKVELCDIENPAFILTKLKELADANKMKIDFPEKIQPEKTEEKNKKKQSKCPNCGANREHDENQCTYCGHIFSKY